MNKHRIISTPSQFGTFLIIECSKCGRLGAATNQDEALNLKTQHARDTFNDRMGLV